MGVSAVLSGPSLSGLGKTFDKTRPGKNIIAGTCKAFQTGNINNMSQSDSEKCDNC